MIDIVDFRKKLLMLLQGVMRESWLLLINIHNTVQEEHSFLTGLQIILQWLSMKI